VALKHPIFRERILKKKEKNNKEDNPFIGALI
jgi:hypothetical protein